MHAHLAIEHDFPLKSLNTFGLDARARHYLRVGTPDDLAAVMRDPVLVGGQSSLTQTVTVTLQRWGAAAEQAGVTTVRVRPEGVAESVKK